MSEDGSIGDNNRLSVLAKMMCRVFLRCMMGYVNASLSVFRVSDFEEKSQSRTNVTELLGESVKYCR